MEAISRITGVALVPLNLPMRQPFVTAMGEKKISRNLLVAVRLADGTAGYGEASASLAWPQETREAMTRVLRPLIARLIGREIRGAERLVQETWEAAARHPTAAAAMECALLDAWARWRGISLWKWLGGKRSSVTTALTLSAWEPKRAARAARRAHTAGFRLLKIKVTGEDLDQDVRRLAAVHQAAPGAVLWVDANQGLTAREAVSLCRSIRALRLPVTLLEQPVRRQETKELRRIEQEGGIPVVADESARTVAQAKAVLRRKLASVVNVKLAKCGLTGAREILRAARASEAKLMIGCMAESSAGLSPSVALACGSGGFDFIDLDSHLLVVSPPCRPGFRTHGPRLCMETGRPGSGVFFSE